MNVIVLHYNGKTSYSWGIFLKITYLQSIGRVKIQGVWGSTLITAVKKFKRYFKEIVKNIHNLDAMDSDYIMSDSLESIDITGTIDIQ